ncbi:MAG: hypothetical protein ABH836_04355 [Candidatus Omnitrophota bacterium]
MKKIGELLAKGVYLNRQKEIEKSSEQNTVQVEGDGIGKSTCQRQFPRQKA